MSASITVMGNGDAEWLKNAIETGVLTAEAEERCRRIVAENDRVRRENDYLRGVIDAKDETISHFRRVSVEALRFKQETTKGNPYTIPIMAGALVAVIAAVRIIEMIALGG